MGKLSREKGANFERKIARWLQNLFPSMDWRRNLDETQQGNVGDVREKSRKLDMVVQCKHMKKPSPLRALDEAQQAAITSNLHPEMGIACIQEHRGTAAVVMDPGLFAVLIATVDKYSEVFGLTTGEFLLRAIEEKIDHGW